MTLSFIHMNFCWHLHHKIELLRFGIWSHLTRLHHRKETQDQSGRILKCMVTNHLKLFFYNPPFIYTPLVLCYILNLHLSTQKIIFLFRCITFHPEGNVLFSGSHDSFKIQRWEPSLGIYDHITMGWGKIRDMAIAATQMVREENTFVQFEKLIWLGYYV